MQNRILQFVAVASLVSIGSLGASVVASENKEPQVMEVKTVAPLEDEEPKVEEQTREPVRETPSVEEEALTQWVHKMMTSLAKEKHDDEYWQSIARDIAIVSLAEMPKNPGKVASALTSLAFHEGRFRPYVDAQLCNDKAWRKTKEGRNLMLRGGDCDGGYAYTLWQIHPWEVRLTGLSLKDRKSAAKVAWQFIQRGGWCGYTGEQEPCTKADSRRTVAVNYLAKHPVVLPSKDEK